MRVLPEAIWRICEFKMHNQSHTVYRLSVHLPDEQPIYFQEGLEEQALRNAATKQTTLEGYFETNSKTPTEYLYTEFPLHYVWKSTYKWSPRIRGGHKIIPRMYSVSPKNTEKYCLRLLLQHIPGATSYEFLRTVDGNLLETFHEACLLLHLLNDDQEWHNALLEASQYQMPCELRTLFAVICIYCAPSDPPYLFECFKESMAEDFMHNRNLLPDESENLVLQHIDSSNKTTCPVKS